MELSIFKKSVLLLILLTATQLLSAHPFGLTVGNLSYSDHKIRFSTRILYDDFRFEFQKTAHVKGKNYVKKGFDKEDKVDLEKYIQQNIRIFVDKKELKLNAYQYAFELHENDVFILILEMSYKTKINKGSHVKIQDSVLLNTIKGQTHLINVFLTDPVTPSHAVITLDKATPEYEFVNE